MDHLVAPLPYSVGLPDPVGHCPIRGAARLAARPLHPLLRLARLPRLRRHRRLTRLEAGAQQRRPLLERRHCQLERVACERARANTRRSAASMQRPSLHRRTRSSAVCAPRMSPFTCTSGGDLGPPKAMRQYLGSAAVAKRLTILGAVEGLSIIQGAAAAAADPFDFRDFSKITKNSIFSKIAKKDRFWQISGLRECRNRIQHQKLYGFIGSK